MEYYFINENIKIKKEDSLFKIDFKYTSYDIINSILITNIIKGGSADDSYKSITFKADSVKTLTQYHNEKKKQHGRKNMLVSDIAKLIRSLVIQISYLIDKEEKTIIGYNPNEIIVINDEKFAFLGSDLIANINHKGMSVISFPFTPTDFFASPELLKIEEIPSLIHYKTSYFSLALLILYCLLGDNEFYSDYLNKKHSGELLELLNNHPVKDTKIYWLLSRCLVEEAKKRSILLI